jgi:hypothetical protein
MSRGHGAALYRSRRAVSIFTVAKSSGEDRNRSTSMCSVSSCRRATGACRSQHDDVSRHIQNMYLQYVRTNSVSRSHGVVRGGPQAPVLDTGILIVDAVRSECDEDIPRQQRSSSS